jgi:hypothetical protein
LPGSALLARLTGRASFAETGALIVKDLLKSWVQPKARDSSSPEDADRRSVANCLSLATVLTPEACVTEAAASSCSHEAGASTPNVSTLKAKRSESKSRWMSFCFSSFADLRSQ